LRVIQEALGNVHRHAAAKQVAVAIKINDEHVVIKITDDGKGIAQSAQSGNGGHPAGLGVPGMHARVRQFGGSLEILGSSNGTTISARIPLAGNPGQVLGRRPKAAASARRQFQGLS
jgi:signal transduction histidine kinase